MIIIFGLGNPGRKYQGTRHNFGRDLINILQKKWSFPPWKKKKKLKAEISEGKFGRKKIILAKSLTFMNKSGKVAKLLIKHYKLPTANLWIIQDEMDLALTKIKIVKNRGSAGHKGVESLIKELGTKDFVRFRMGIKKNGERKTENKKLEFKDKFVLQKFQGREKRLATKIIRKTIRAIEKALKEGVEKAMQEFN